MYRGDDEAAFVATVTNHQQIDIDFKVVRTLTGDRNEANFTSKTLLHKLCQRSAI